MSPEIKNRQRKLRTIIRAEAYRLGFHLVGVTSPDPPDHLDVLNNWLAQNHHAGMTWMATTLSRERRADPLKIMPGCKSILVLGAQYPAPPTADFLETSSRKEGQIAAYAQGDDYHDVLLDRLKALVDFIQCQAEREIPYRLYTDTGPILERELAQRAGLGWIGKNSCLINPVMGSYILLAEILLGFELEPDEPFMADRCGKCTRCLDHCPTACIQPDRTIDANRCISYLTIEHKGLIPFDLRNKIGNWLFGCDICQQVCPWNLQASANIPKGEKIYPSFMSRPGIPPDSLADELGLTPEAFNAKFKGSPIKRTKRRGYLRNIATVLGNQGKTNVVPALLIALKDDEPLVRSHAAWALGQIGGEDSTQALEQAREAEKEPDVLTEIKAALTHCCLARGM